MDPYDALALVGLEGTGGSFPGTDVGRRAAARGDRPRRCQEPDVLFCDEPTGALDSMTGRTVLNVLRDVNEKLGATVLIVTHAASQAAMADRVIHFADGNIREIVGTSTSGPPRKSSGEPARPASCCAICGA